MECARLHAAHVRFVHKIFHTNVLATKSEETSVGIDHNSCTCDKNSQKDRKVLEVLGALSEMYISKRTAKPQTIYQTSLLIF